MSIYLEIGIPSLSGQKRLKFLLAKSAEPSSDDNKFFEFEDLMEIPVRTINTVKEIKQKVLDLLKENPLFANLSPQNIRFREKSADKLVSVFHDACILEKYTMFDGKEIAI